MSNFLSNIFHKLSESHHPIATAIKNTTQTIKDATQNFAQNVAQKVSNMTPEQAKSIFLEQCEKLGLDKHSIVDMLTVAGLPHDIGSRRKMAKEKGYKGDLNDTSSMNQFLLNDVMNDVAAGVIHAAQNIASHDVSGGGEPKA